MQVRRVWSEGLHVGILFAVCAALANDSYAQSFDFDRQRYPTGLVASPEAELDAFPAATVSRAYIPEAIDLSSRFPQPRQQQHSSCTAWAVGYAARSYYAQFDGGVRTIDETRIASPAYIYNKTYFPGARGGCKDAGSTYVHALRLLQREGAASLAAYGVDATCDPSRAQSQAPTGFRIKNALNLALRPRRNLNPDAVKQMLAQGHPVMIGLKIDNAFVSLRPTEIYAGIPSATWASLREAPGHALVLVGYDDRRSAYRIFNSWDTTWADGGYGWIAERALVNQASEAWVMIPDVTPPRPQSARPIAPAVAMPPLLQDAVGGFTCADIQISRLKSGTDRDDSGSRPRLTGFVSLPADLVQLTEISERAGLVNEVDLRPWPLCEAQLILREPLRAPSRPLIERMGADRPLKVGDTLSFRITPPDRPAFLYVYYLEDDGTVVNLVPRGGLLRKMTAPGAPAMLFGDGLEGRPRFKVTPLKSVDASGRPRDRLDPVRGYEAVIAIAARAPIEELEALESPDNIFFRHGSRAAGPGASAPDRLLLSLLKDIVLRRTGPDDLPREVAADVLPLFIEDN